MSDRAVLAVALAAALGAAAALEVARPVVWALLVVALLVPVALRAAAASDARSVAPAVAGRDGATVVATSALLAPSASASAAASPAVAVALAACVAVWTTSGAARALDALRTGPSGAYDGPAVLVGDPVPLAHGTRVDLRIAGRRVEATAGRELSTRLQQLLAGEGIEVRGRYVARPSDAPWLDARHIAGRFQITELGARRGASPPYAVANAVRRVLERGASTLAPGQRSLYTGLVYGDDREQPALLADDFRAGGLGHLLAVSGQNVAFALAAAGPLLRRVSWRARWPATLGVLVLFVLVTRAEPSVLRAATMAAIASGAATSGRTATGVRTLALAATVLLCVDPLLVRAVGFQLSVAASLGILVGSRPIAARLRGPTAWREAVAVTLSAQLAVAPLAALVFGGVPLASVPANLLALPAAGAVMVWGLTGGVAAGVLGPWAGAVVHLPTRGLLWWITVIAGHAGRAPLGMAGPRHVVVLGVALAVLVHRPRRRAATQASVAVRRGVAQVLTVVTLASCVVAAHRPAPRAGELVPDVWLWRSGGVVVELGSSPTSPTTLRALREAGVTTLDVLVVRGGGSQAAAVARDLRARYDPPVVWAPARHVVRGASTPAPGTTLRVGGLVVRVEESDARVGVSVLAV